MKTFQMLNIEKPPHLQARNTNRPQHVLIEWYNYNASFSKHGKKNPQKGKCLKRKTMGLLHVTVMIIYLPIFFLPIFYSVIE